MSAVEELETIINVSEKVSDQPNDSSVVCQLLEQWAGRHTAQDQKLAWASLEGEPLNRHGLSSGFIWWMLRAEQRGELRASLPQLCRYGHIHPTTDLLHIVLRKMEQDITFPLSSDWTNATRIIFYRIREWGKDNPTPDATVLNLVETIRQKIAQHDMAWSEKLCADLHKRVRMHLYKDSTSIVEQQKIIKDLQRHFVKHNHGLLSNLPAVSTFLDKLSNYTLEEQNQKDGVLFGAVETLLNQCNAACLEFALNDLQTKGWRKPQLWACMEQSGVIQKCHALNHNYVDALNKVANAKQRKQLFTWVIEGIATQIYKIDPKELLGHVQVVLGKPYAQPTVFNVQLEDLRAYTDYTTLQWENDPKMNKEYPYDRYARTGLNLESCEEFVAVNCAHFSSNEMQQAVDLLNTVTNPSLQGMLEFWGRLHNIDFGIEKPQTFILQTHYYSAGQHNGDAHLWEKAQEVAQRIAIGGHLPQKHNTVTRKI